MQPSFVFLNADGWQEYALLDSGDGRKLERFGPYTFVRSEPRAMWRPALPARQWDVADAVFQLTGEESGGNWGFRRKLPATWTLQYKGLRFEAQATSSRHMGVFPEQAVHWDWIASQIRAVQRPVRVLNLFGYTGLATLAAAQAGAEVTHVDAAKRAITQARRNQELSGLAERPIRWIVEDALKYIQREVRRGSRYDGLILDPPKFGRGAGGKVWEFFEHFPELLDTCRELLSPKPLFVVLTAYAVQASALYLYHALEGRLSELGGALTAGELVTVERSAGRWLSQAIFARWTALG
ncbi:MAG: class I SAM-dependent methyltransferase [Anaerolineae bacterium]|nr:class I SAM-dependent methyltransferase [Anaerolineae bacterium]